MIFKESLKRFLDSVESIGRSYLITGASGLIGSSLVDLMMTVNGENNKKNHIYVLGRSEKKLKDRFHSYIGSPYFHIIEQDICNPLDNGIHFDYIIHGASNADPVSYAKFPTETMITNLVGSFNILEYGKHNKACKIVIMSSFEVYGDLGKDVYLEEDFGLLDFNLLRSCYPESKRSVEVMARCYCAEYGVDVKIARLSSVYGPVMAKDDSKAHAQFLRKAVLGENIVLKSKGLQRRSYTYVLDAITGIFCILYHGTTGTAYNISNENSIATIAEVAQTCADISGSKVVYDVPSQLEVKGFSKPQNCVLDNSKIKKLGWSACYNLEQGLRETVFSLREW